MLPNGDSAQVPPAARPRGGDRRAHPRVRAFPGGLSELLVAEVADFSGCFILDLGEGGMAVQLAGPAPPLPEFKVHFKLDCGALSIDAKARPAWHDGKGNLGLCFVELADECRDQFINWLNGKDGQIEAHAPTSGPPEGEASPTDTWSQTIQTPHVLEGIPAPELSVAQPDPADLARAAEAIPGPDPGSEGSVLAGIVARACQLTHAGGAALALAEEDGRVLCKASVGKAPKVGKALNPSGGLSGQCIRTGQAVKCDDADQDLRVPLAVSRDLGLQSIVVVPIQANGRVVGILEVTSGAKAAFTPEHVSTLQRLAKEAASFAATAPLQESPPPRWHGGVRGRAILRDSDTTLDDGISSSVPRSSHNGDEGGGSLAPIPSENPLTPRTSYRDAAFAQNSQTRQSAGDLIANLRAATSREASHEGHSAMPDPPHPLDKYRNLVAAAVDITRKLKDPSPRSVTLVPHVPRGRALLLLAGIVLVGAMAGWALSVMLTPVDLSVSAPPPPVSDGLVLLISRPARYAGTTDKPLPSNLPIRSGGWVEVPPDLAAGQILAWVEPAYPEEAKAKKITGMVSLTVLVQQSGSVQEVQEVNGNPLLVDAAVKAVKQWRYKRFLFRGHAVEVLTKVRFLFTLPGR